MNERIWIYTISRPLNDSEILWLTEQCKHFVDHWTAHEVKLDASFELYKNRLLIFKVDEASYNASGCSIDKQLRFVKEAEQHLGVQLLNRLLVAYEDATGTIQVVPSVQIKDLLQQGVIHENTPVYNNTITQTADMPAQWRLPLAQTWLGKYLGSTVK